MAVIEAHDGANFEGSKLSVILKIRDNWLMKLTTVLKRVLAKPIDFISCLKKPAEVFCVFLPFPFSTRYELA